MINQWKGHEGGIGMVSVYTLFSDRPTVKKVQPMAQDIMAHGPADLICQQSLKFFFALIVEVFTYSRDPAHSKILQLHNLSELLQCVERRTDPGKLLKYAVES